MQNNVNPKLVPFYTENPGGKNSYTLYFDPNTHEVFKAEDKKVGASRFTFIFLAFYVFARSFSIEIIPFDNVIVYSIICLLIFLLALMLGYYLRTKLLDNIKKVTLSPEEWERYLNKGNHFYLRQIIFTISLIILSAACFVFLYIFPSKWWLFGGIGLGIVAGTFLIILSKTKYKLYKNKIDINFNDGRENR